MTKGKQGGRREFVQLSRDKGDYTPFAIQENWTEKEARKEYARLRNIVVKRLKRISEKDPNARVLQKYPIERFVIQSEIKDVRTLSHLLSDVAHLVNAKTASLTGIREIEEKTIKTLHEHGFNIEKKDLKEFGEYIELVRDFTSDRIYDSERAEKLFENYHERINNIELTKAYVKWAKRRRTRPRSTRR